MEKPVPLSPTSVPSEFWTNTGVFLGAVAMSLAGMWRGYQKLKKKLFDEPEDGKKQILSAAIMETVSIQQWSESNRASTEQVRLLCNHLDEVVEEIRDHRSSARDFTDEVRKLRLIMSDLSEALRAFKR